MPSEVTIMVATIAHPVRSTSSLRRMQRHTASVATAGAARSGALARSTAAPIGEPKWCPALRYERPCLL